MSDRRRKRLLNERQLRYHGQARNHRSFVLLQLLAWGKIGLPFGACLRLRIIDDFWTIEGLSLIRKGVN